MQVASITLHAAAAASVLSLAVALAPQPAAAQSGLSTGGAAPPPPPGRPAGLHRTPPGQTPPSPGASGQLAGSGGGGGGGGGGGLGGAAAGGFQGAGLFQCHPTYNKIAQFMPPPGQVSAYYECESPTVVQCPDKSAVKHPYGGASAAGMGIEVKAVPVGQVGDYNRYKIQYKCSYYWNQG